MKTFQLFGTAFCGLAFSFSAHAQTPVIGPPGTTAGTPGSVTTPGIGTGAVVPGQAGAVNPGTMNPGALPTGPVPASATAPTSTAGQLYSNGAVPARNVDGGTLRADQPVGGNPATTGAPPTRRLNRARTSITNTTTPGRSFRPGPASQSACRSWPA